MRSLVVLAALGLGEVVTRLLVVSDNLYLSSPCFSGSSGRRKKRNGVDKHVVRELLQVLLLLLELLLQFQQLLLLALLDGVVLGGALAALEGITVLSSSARSS